MVFSLFVMTGSLLAVLFLDNKAEGNEASDIVRPFIQEFITQNAAQLGRSKQLIFATNRNASSFVVKIHSLEENGGVWKLGIPAFIGTIGEKGFASLNKKKEGDGRSPTGIFSLGTAFGYGPSVATKMPYRQSTEDDFWVDDANSEDYNRWVKGKPKAASVERMKREDDLYKYGIVIDYNTNPVIRGKGSAIFLHIWGGVGRPTLGCVGVPEEKVLSLLGWLDPAEKPLIIMGTEAELRAMRSQ
jgi:L,D-peptidoglycan transpeptidase YkuD (ErfK/YbiS/YcfS/YnhG family)